MFKNRYEFNQETLSYDRIERTFKERFTKILLLGFSVFSGILLISLAVFLYFFDATDYITSQREKRMIVAQYEQLEERVEQLNAVLEELQGRDDNLYRLVLNAEPIPSSVRNAGFGGTDRYKALREFENSDLIISTTRKIDELSKKIVIQSQSYDEVIELAREKALMVRCLPAIRPVSGRESEITSYYGYRMHPILNTPRMHTGVDFAAPRGTFVYATGDGTISETHYNGGYGRQIVIDHGFGYKSSYAHLNKILVSEGQAVKRGDLIGEVGNSGLSTSTHLHYEVYLNGQMVNPINYFFDDINPEELAE
jgi:murein DD-endopeptidase MepM/ murein hydrolase activator NlpD